MVDTLNSSRRNLLKALAGAPILPLAGSVSVATLLAACGNGDDSDFSPAPGVTFQSAAFTPTAAPTLANPAQMATTTVAFSVKHASVIGTRAGHPARQAPRRIQLAPQPLTRVTVSVPPACHLPYANADPTSPPPNA